MPEPDPIKLEAHYLHDQAGALGFVASVLQARGHEEIGHEWEHWVNSLTEAAGLITNHLTGQGVRAYLRHVQDHLDSNQVATRAFLALQETVDADDNGKISDPSDEERAAFDQFRLLRSLSTATPEAKAAVSRFFNPDDALHDALVEKLADYLATLPPTAKLLHGDPDRSRWPPIQEGNAENFMRLLDQERIYQIADWLEKDWQITATYPQLAAAAVEHANADLATWRAVYDDTQIELQAYLPSGAEVTGAAEVGGPTIEVSGADPTVVKVDGSQIAAPRWARGVLSWRVGDGNPIGGAIRFYRDVGQDLDTSRYRLIGNVTVPKGHGTNYHGVALDWSRGRSARFIVSGAPKAVPPQSGDDGTHSDDRGDGFDYKLLFSIIGVLPAGTAAEYLYKRRKKRRQEREERERREREEQAQRGHDDADEHRHDDDAINLDDVAGDFGSVSMPGRDSDGGRFIDRESQRVTTPVAETGHGGRDGRPGEGTDERPDDDGGGSDHGGAREGPHGRR